MYSEDLLSYLLKSNIRINPHDLVVLKSLHSQYSSGNLFTEKQSFLLVKLLKKYELWLRSIYPNIDLSNPIFKSPFRKINVTKKISIDANPIGKTIKINFPYDETIVNSLKEISKSKVTFGYQAGDKTWTCLLNEKNIISLMPFIEQFQFEVDEEFSQYIDQINSIKENIEKYIPCLVFNNNSYQIINLPPNVDIPQLDTLENAVFTARRFGVTVWDNEIEKQIHEEFDDTTIKFLKSNPKEIFDPIAMEKSFDDIKVIVKNLLPCVVIIPPEIELKKLKLSLEFFNQIGISNKEMSVLFRLSNATDEEFNQYVRDNNLNSPLTDQTSVVFLNQQLPKTILLSTTKFNSILNLSGFALHNSLSKFVRYHENIINLHEHTQRRFSFAGL